MNFLMNWKPTVNPSLVPATAIGVASMDNRNKDNTTGTAAGLEKSINASVQREM
ncbi:hypothetical protein [Chitinophaga nivalis]|uniref:Uncharacterized protein n=1 Tax=Chitinophaga nivalis TaxID=2991709 RepID=A0ABT3IJY1_9BACT|nr:hypothetical protein [Chitinophaga nivalis]MCW3466044.1 hypothetical protein [Chitinophaga nivalis]MCW3484265.1 hypothetical protein [Chitinophaga nivalis]